MFVLQQSEKLAFGFGSGIAIKSDNIKIGDFLVKRRSEEHLVIAVFTHRSASA